MKLREILIALFILAVSGAKAQNSPDPSGIVSSARSLIDRLAGHRSGSFHIRYIPAGNGKDVFELISPGKKRSSGSRIILSGSSVAAIGYAFHWYLTYFCHSQLSKAGEQMDIPISLPFVDKKIRRESPYADRYYLNYCTFNYTMAFWNWPRWEKELDWMALNGINMSLSVIGMEAVWQNTLRRYSFTDAEIKAFIPGPAYTAWWLMGNLEGWGGPVSQEWIDSRVVLERKILQRMHELGIRPVMQGFYGIVPDRLRKKFPDSKTHYGGIWAGDHGFQRPAFLDPQDSLFGSMAKTFYDEQQKLYGNAEFYGGDPFHEGGDLTGIDVTRSAALIHTAMLEAHPSSTWVLQGWFGNPTDDLLKGIGKDQVMVLDLFAEGDPQWERRKGYDGRKWAWCTLLNFGSKVGIYGRLDTIAKAPPRALSSPYGRSLCGIGTMSEGIETNPVSYELVYQMAWRRQAPDMRQWIKDFANARYGKKMPAAEQAWEILHQTAYNCPGKQYGTSESVFCAEPSTNDTAAWRFGTTRIYYDPEKLRQALYLLLSCAGELKNIDTYQYDLVDLARQVIANYGQVVYHRMIDAYDKGEAALFDDYAGQFTGLILKQDSLLATRKEFLLGRWIDAAKAIAARPADTAVMEWNARTLITLWGDQGVAEELNGYSNREWSGMLKDYYLPRWVYFIGTLKAKLNGVFFPPVDYYPMEKEWTLKNNAYPARASGNPVEMARSVINSIWTKGLICPREP